MSKNYYNFEDLESDEFRIKLYPEDHLYRSNLAKRINCDPSTLMPIIGPDEFSSILSKYTYDNFDPGRKFENLKDETFRANLHIHTTESDGEMTIESLLNQAVEYSEKLTEPPFLFAITNHDSLKDSQKAVNMVSEFPSKYKNIRLVIGVELSTKYVNPEILNTPLRFETIGYCIDPFEEEINLYLDQYKNNNLDFTKNFIEKFINKGLDVSFEQARSYHNNVNIGTSSGLLFILKEFLLLKAEEQQINPKIVYELFEEHKKQMGNEFLTGHTPELDKIFTLFNSGIFGIAHPGRIYIDSLKKGVSYQEALKVFFTDFKKLGGAASELNYVYPGDYFNNVFKDYLKDINEICSDLNLLKTGGIDNHGPTIFIR